MAFSSENTPLLVDPPIDDESYRREARTFPSDEQKHLMFASYTLTSLISRFFEIISTLLMAVAFPSSLYPITVFSFLILWSSSYTQRVCFSVARFFKSRLRLLSVSIVFQRVSVIVFSILLIEREAVSHWLYTVFVVAALTFSVIILKASLYLYQSAFRRDWLYILSNGKDSVRLHFETSTHAVSVLMQLLLPIATGLLAGSLAGTESARVLMFLSTLGLFVELSLIWKLHSTCYALHLPRSSLSLETIELASSTSNISLDSHPMIGVLTTPIDTLGLSKRHLHTYSRPLPRIYNYVKRKPTPVIVTFGVILINVSLITMGPHMVWFLLRQSVNPAVAGVFKMLQTLITLHPALSAPKAFNLSTAGSLLAVAFLAIITWQPHTSKVWVYLFAVAVILARSGIQTINVIGDQFVEDFLGDEEVHKVYKENAIWLRTQCELIVHVLTVLFPTVNLFIYPIAISATLTLVGRVLILRTIRNHWKPDQ